MTDARNRRAMMVKAKIHWRAIMTMRNWYTPRAEMNVNKDLVDDRVNETYHRRGLRARSQEPNL